MILQGNQRGGASDLARHLLKDENEHVEVHEIRGFVSDDLHGAFKEAYAVSKGTRAKQFLYSLSLNPPGQEKVSTQDFRDAIETVEQRLNLNDQPRAIVFHEKEGRRHAHAVWSRIDTSEMKAIPLPHTKRKLMEISRDLYVQHGWKMPEGMIDRNNRDPRNFTLAQWQQAKRIGKNPKEIKRAFQEAWAISDNQSSFANALKERGYILARGDRRGFVALNHRCEVFSVPKWVGLKTKEIREKLQDQADLPSVDEAKTKFSQDMLDRLKQIQNVQDGKVNARAALLEEQRTAMVKKHKQEREELEQRISLRRTQETKERQDRFRHGFSGLWDRVTGTHKRIRQQNEIESYRALHRDMQEKDKLIHQQLEQRQSLKQREDRLENYKVQREDSISRDIKQYQEIKSQKRNIFDVAYGQEKNEQQLER